MKRSYLAALLAVALLALHPSAASDAPMRVALAALVVEPKRFDDSDVLVVAWGVIEHEGAALYLSRSDRDFLVTESGVWLDVPNEPREGIQLPKPPGYMGYMSVRGQFKAGDPVRGFAGRITNIKQLNLLPEHLVPSLPSH